ncbi:uncharacterized protein LOC135712588 [Ochlerotatus camptorhynchus]|uniref:uncharacterized protein LOC135712588 n=1 Tax=Ochlerotatus camptorhynchus TaxID=644619 RepID=UPI0031DA8292
MLFQSTGIFFNHSRRSNGCFQGLTPQQRFEFVEKHGLCINCLKGTHLGKDCSSASCKQCYKKHHSLLHLPPMSSSSVPGTSVATPVFVGQPATAISSQSSQMSQRDATIVARSPPAETGSSLLVNLSSRSFPQSVSVGIDPSTSPVLHVLSKLIKVKDADNNEHFARALLDSGSQPSFITESLCQKLRLKHVKLNSPVSGIGQSTKTVLGYIVCGKVVDPAPDPQAVQTFCMNDTLDKLERFWEVENVDVGKAYTIREEILSILGDSYPLALRWLQSMEEKFAVDEGLREAYHAFMEEYERLGRMEEVNPSASRNPQFFLPHHAIHRPESTTTKIRPALYSTVINIRMPRFAVTADGEKMFRQIWTHPDDRKYQDPSESVHVYRLKTVTYDLAASPFHATRVLDQWAIDEGDRFPLAVPVAKKGTCVDPLDCLTNVASEVLKNCREQ